MGTFIPIQANLLDGGEVNTKPPHEIGYSEAASAVNTDPREYRGAKTRKGRETFGGTNGSGVGVKGIKAWQRNSGTNYLVYRTGTTFWHASSAGVASIGIGGDNNDLMQAAALDNLLVIVVDGLAPQKWPATADMSALAGNPPSEAKYVAIYVSKVFLAGDDANPQTIYFGATNNAEQYSSSAAPNDAGSITSQEGGGDTIQGLRACRKWLCIFYRYYTEILIGNTVFNFAIDRLTDHGLVSQTGHCGTGDVAFFASDEAVYMVAGARAADITTAKVRTWYQAISDKSKITLALKGDLLLVIDYGSGQAYACDYKTGRWACWTDQYWECVDTANDLTLYGGPSASTVQIYKLDSGTADGASAISAYWRTGNLGFGRNDCVKNVAEMRVLALPGMPTTTITFYKNGTADSTTKDLTFASTGDITWSKTSRRSDFRACFISAKMSWSGPGTLYGYTLYGEYTAEEGMIPNEVG